jgi:hypothetical protein
MRWAVDHARFSLLFLSGLSAISLVGIWLRPMHLAIPSRHHFPKAERLFQGAAQLVGTVSSRLISSQPSTGREIAHGQVTRWKATLQDGRELALTEVPIRVRSFNNFELKRMKSLLSLPSADANGKPPRRQGVYQAGSDQILVSETSRGLLAESCITSDDEIGHVSQYQLIEPIKQTPLNSQQRLEAIVGLRQPRKWQCLYIAATVPSPSKNFLDATSAWRQLRQAELISPGPEQLN